MRSLSNRLRELETPVRKKPYPYALRLETDLSADTLKERLGEWAPWPQRIEFSNGVSTADFERRMPFNQGPLAKLSKVKEKIPFEELRGGTVLDIGCNSGHNSIFVAKEFGMRPVGIDVVERHIQTARFLSDLAGVEAEFLQGSAESFQRPETFDVVLHFGTLYHLENPLQSLRSACISLKPGGYLALATQCYDDAADWRSCYFMHTATNDAWWALSRKVLQEFLSLIGFTMIEEIFSVPLKPSGRTSTKYMTRTIFTAKKRSND